MNTEKMIKIINLYNDSIRPDSITSQIHFIGGITGALQIKEELGINTDNIIGFKQHIIIDNIFCNMALQGIFLKEHQIDLGIFDDCKKDITDEDLMLIGLL